MPYAGFIPENEQQPSRLAGLEELRKSLGLSRREVSELTGFTPSRIWTIERSPSAQARDTYDARRILDAMEAWSKANPNGKPASNKPRTTTATLRHAVKVALDGLLTIAATEEDSLRRASLNELVKQITTAAFEESAK